MKGSITKKSVKITILRKVARTATETIIGIIVVQQQSKQKLILESNSVLLLLSPAAKSSQNLNLQMLMS